MRSRLWLATIVGLLWGALEAAFGSGARDPLTIVALHPPVVALMLPLAALAARAWRGPGRLGREALLLVAAAVAVPLAVWASQHFVSGIPFVSVTNAALLAGALLAGMVPGVFLGAPLAALAQALSRRGGAVAWLPLIVLVASALRVASALSPEAPGPWPAAAGRRDGRASVVLVLLDTVRADHVSGNGYARPTTPHLDALPGTRFAHAYAQAHWTAPSTASLLTGLYPSTHGTNRIGDVLPEAAVTLAERLADAGWITGYATANYAVSETFGFTQGADWIVSEARLPVQRLMPCSLGRILARKAADLSHADAVDDLVEPFLEAVGDRRFFLYVHYKDPHHPYVPPPPYDERFDPGFTGRRIIDPSIASQWPIAEDERRNMVARYDGELAFLDAQVGRLIDTLTRLGRRQDTIVIVTSDHGEEFADHGGWIHGETVYEEMIHVPLIVSHPRDLVAHRDARPAQHADDGLASLVDVVPTLLDLLELPADAALAGRSLAPRLGGGAGGRNEATVVAEGVKSNLAAILDGHFKLVVETTSDGERARLFDLDADPGETRDVAATHPERAAALLSELRRRVEAWRAVALPSRSVPLDARATEALRQLGYVK